MTRVSVLLLALAVSPLSPTTTFADNVTPPPPAASITGVQAARLYDSRDAGVTVDGQGQGEGPLEVGEVRRIALAGRAGVVGDSRGLILNITVARPETVGWLRVWPCDQVEPATSTLNFWVNENRANTAVLALGTQGLCVRSTGRTDLVVDLVDQFEPIAGFADGAVAQRILDTRPIDGGSNPVHGWMADLLTEGGPASFLNVTAVHPKHGGFVSVTSCPAWPDDSSPPTSNVNFMAGETTANMVVVPAGMPLCVYASADTDIVIDLLGSLPASATSLVTEEFGAQFRGLYNSLGDFHAAERMTDTRREEQAIERLVPGEPVRIPGRQTSMDVPEDGPAWPAAADVAIVNLTAANPEGEGFLTAYDCDQPQPAVSTMNIFYLNRAHLTFVPLSADGSFCVVSTTGTDLVVDRQGWFTTATGPPSMVEDWNDVTLVHPPGGTEHDVWLHVGRGTAPYDLTITAPAGWTYTIDAMAQPGGTGNVRLRFTHPLLMIGVTYPITIDIADQSGTTATIQTSVTAALLIP